MQDESVKMTPEKKTITYLLFNFTAPNRMILHIKYLLYATTFSWHTFTFNFTIWQLLTISSVVTDRTRNN